MKLTGNVEGFVEVNIQLNEGVLLGSLEGTNRETISLMLSEELQQVCNMLANFLASTIHAGFLWVLFIHSFKENLHKTLDECEGYLKVARQGINPIEIISRAISDMNDDPEVDIGPFEDYLNSLDIDEDTDE